MTIIFPIIKLFFFKSCNVLSNASSPFLFAIIHLSQIITFVYLSNLHVAGLSIILKIGFSVKLKLIGNFKAE